MEKLLLHHCCAPCTPPALEAFSKEYSVCSFWFNPNIQPFEEHEKRKNTLDAYLEAAGCARAAADPVNSPDDWIWKGSKQVSQRCRLCWYLRLKTAAKEAKKMGIGCFSSTLLSSLHQDHEDIKHIGFQAASEEGLSFIYRDFRPLYYDGRNRVKQAGFYSQNYCGCLPSLDESRERKKKQPL